MSPPFLRTSAIFKKRHERLLIVEDFCRTMIGAMRSCAGRTSDLRWAVAAMRLTAAGLRAHLFNPFSSHCAFLLDRLRRLETATVAQHPEVDNSCYRLPTRIVVNGRIC